MRVRWGQWSARKYLEERATREKGDGPFQGGKVVDKLHMQVRSLSPRGRGAEGGKCGRGPMGDLFWRLLGDSWGWGVKKGRNLRRP